MPSLRGGRRSLTAKVLTISAISMGIGFGTCGLGVLTVPSRFAVFLIYPGAIVFFGSLAILVIMILIALGNRIAESMRK